MKTNYNGVLMAFHGSLFPLPFFQIKGRSIIVFMMIENGIQVSSEYSYKMVFPFSNGKKHSKLQNQSRLCSEAYTVKVIYCDRNCQKYVYYKKKIMCKDTRFIQ